MIEKNIQIFNSDIALTGSYLYTKNLTSSNIATKRQSSEAEKIIKKHFSKNIRILDIPLEIERDPDRADGLFGGTAIRPRDPGDRQRGSDTEAAACPCRHGARHRFAHRAMFAQRRSRYTEKALLHRIGVGDHAAHHHIAAARNGGESLAEHTSRATFGDGDRDAALATGRQHDLREVDVTLAVDRMPHRAAHALRRRGEARVGLVRRQSAHGEAQVHAFHVREIRQLHVANALRERRDPVGRERLGHTGAAQRA